MYTLISFIITHIILAALSKLTNVHSYATDHLILSWGSNTSLMLTVKGKSIFIDIFGGQIGFSFDSEQSYDSDSIPKFIGFNSSDGEIFCKELWIYNPFTKKNHILTAPWDTTQVLLTREYLDIETGYLVDNSIPVKTITDTNYYTKSGDVQHIGQVDFYLMCRTWTSKLAKLLMLDRFFYTRKVNLVFEIKDEAGLGYSDDHIGLISLHQESIYAFDAYRFHHTEENKEHLITLIEERIGYFMMIDKNY